MLSQASKKSMVNCHPDVIGLPCVCFFLGVLVYLKNLTQISQTLKPALQPGFLGRSSINLFPKSQC